MAGIPGISGGGGSSFLNDDSADLLQSRSSIGETSLSSPFTFKGDAGGAVGGSVPAWVIALVVVALVAIKIRGG